MQIAAAEVHGRGGHTIIITDKPSLAQASFSDDVIVIPTNGPLTALLAIVPLQFLAYEIAILRGIDPDKPRNLAKAVTVD
jgi:glutamine---fructose-6-phosphate transaminase (isomerizing)